MKYGESLFDIMYLLFAIISGLFILKKADSIAERYMGMAALFLGIGDAFHLVPRVLDHFIEADFTKALGIGKFITSITMTIFYAFMYEIYLKTYGEKDDGRLRHVIHILVLLRIILCLFPQNGWLENSSDVLWGCIRNFPFVVLGAIIIGLYFRKRDANQNFRWIWLLILLSFAFYMPVAIFAGLKPMLGMLMLPKTVCYILMIFVFLRAVKQ